MMLEELQRRNYSQATVRVICWQSGSSPSTSTGRRIILVQITSGDFSVISCRRGSSAPNRRAASGGTAIPLREDAQASLHAGAHTLPQGGAPASIVLSQEEVGRLIDSASNLLHRTMLMTLYSTGIRRAELCRLQVCDIDSQRKLMHIRPARGPRPRRAAQPKLLETLREYWRWMKPKTYLFPVQ